MVRMMKRYIAALCLLTFALLALQGRDGTLVALILVPFVGVVCGSAKGAGEVVSSRKTAAVQPSAESYVPEVEIPDAELEELPVDTLEGLEPAHVKALRKEGIETLQDLLERQADELAKICGVEQDRAQLWIATARFAWLKSVSEEDAEAIVYGGGMIGLEELAAADPKTLFDNISQAIELGHVKMPKGYKITLKNVEKWVNEARDLI